MTGAVLTLPDSSGSRSRPIPCHALISVCSCERPPKRHADQGHELQRVLAGVATTLNQRGLGLDGLGQQAPESCGGNHYHGGEPRVVHWIQLAFKVRAMLWPPLVTAAARTLPRSSGWRSSIRCRASFSWVKWLIGSFGGGLKQHCGPHETGRSSGHGRGSKRSPALQRGKHGPLDTEVSGGRRSPRGFLSAVVPGWRWRFRHRDGDSTIAAGHG